MSIMVCSKCRDCVTKEDFWKFDFERHMCESCSVEAEEKEEEIIEKITKGQNLNDVLGSRQE